MCNLAPENTSLYVDTPSVNSKCTSNTASFSSACMSHDCDLVKRYSEPALGGNWPDAGSMWQIPDPLSQTVYELSNEIL